MTQGSPSKRKDHKGLLPVWYASEKMLRDKSLRTAMLEGVPGSVRVLQLTRSRDEAILDRVLMSHVLLNIAECDDEAQQELEEYATKAGMTEVMARALAQGRAPAPLAACRLVSAVRGLSHREPDARVVAKAAITQAIEDCGGSTEVVAALLHALDADCDAGATTHGVHAIVLTHVGALKKEMDVLKDELKSDVQLCQTNQSRMEAKLDLLINAAGLHATSSSAPKGKEGVALSALLV
jgi:hypothetical protein